MKEHTLLIGAREMDLLLLTHLAEETSLIYSSLTLWLHTIGTSLLFPKIHAYNIRCKIN